MISAIKEFFETWSELQKFQKSSPTARRLSVYSEGSQDWPHLGPILKEYLKLSPKAEVSYLSSDRKDPGLAFEDARFHRFFIGSGVSRTILFKSIDTKVFFMTLPDLNTFALKRSTFPVHYVYTFHSINSTHTVYRDRAFESFDTIFCVGPHHVDELRKEESLRGLKGRRLLNLGSIKLDALLSGRAKSEAIRKAQGLPLVLLAPSWGACSFAEDLELLSKVISETVARGYRVSLRFHPMTVRRLPKLVAEIRERHQDLISKQLFIMEEDMNNNQSLEESVLMVSDWSGAATEYAFALEKPVLFLDTPQKINNPRHGDFKRAGIEDFIRQEIGTVVSPSQIHKFGEALDSLIASRDTYPERARAALNKWVFNVGTSAVVGARHLKDIVGTQN